MQALDVDLGGREPAVWFGELLDHLGGEWHVEAARDAWRAERSVDGFLWTVGLERAGDGWVVGWRAEAEVPDGWGLGLMVASLMAAAGVLGAAGWLGWLGPGALLASVATIAASLAVGRRVLHARLPATHGPTEALGRAVAEAVQGQGRR